LTLILLGLLISLSEPAPAKIYAAWYCADDGCTWGQAPNLNNAQWLLNRGDNRPTINLIIFAFIDPLALLQRTNNGIFNNGVPKAITADVVNFFKGKGIGVLFSIGGAEYTSKWDQALQQDATTLAKNAATLAKQFGVGIEIDYENEAHITQLDTFVKAYRSSIPYDMSEPFQNLLTIDVGAGTGYLTSLSKAASGWLDSNSINWISAMVAGAPYGSISEASMYWQQHLDGASWASVPPVAPSKMIVSLYSSSSSKNCGSYSGTVLEGAVGWVNQKKSRGISFWAVGCPAPPSNCAVNCTGVQQGSRAFLGNQEVPVLHKVDSPFPKHQRAPLI